MIKNPALLKIRCWLLLYIVLLIAPPQARAGQGWYLMVPPPLKGTKGQYTVDFQAPLRKWDQVKAYDTAQQCEEGLMFRVEFLEGKLKSMTDKDKDKTSTERHISEMAWARCIASDDPRLK